MVNHLKQMEVFHRLNDSKQEKLDILIKLPRKIADIIKKGTNVKYFHNELG